MGCCDKKEGCSVQKPGIKSFPWFRCVLGLLALLVVINWH